CLIVVCLSLGIAMALGIAAAAIQVSFQKGSAVLWMLSTGVWFLSGAMFPVESLPHPLVVIAQVIPLTYAIEGLRMALLQGRTVVAMAATLITLGGFCGVLIPLSYWGLSLSLRRARQNGTLSFY